MIHTDPKPEIYYLDSTRTLQISDTEPVEPLSTLFVKTQNEKIMALFLINNPWKYHENYSTFNGFVYNLFGYNYKYCIVCGKNRFKNFPYKIKYKFDDVATRCTRDVCRMIMSSLFWDDWEIYNAIHSKEFKKITYYIKDSRDFSCDLAFFWSKTTPVPLKFPSNVDCSSVKFEYETEIQEVEF